MSTSNGATLHNERPQHTTLRAKQDFDRVYSGGLAQRGEFVVLIHCANQLGCLRTAVVASRRVGGAVQRNRAKRLLRVAIRTLFSGSRANLIDVVLVARPGLPSKRSDSVVAAIEQLCGRAGIPTARGLCGA